MGVSEMARGHRFRYDKRVSEKRGAALGMTPMSVNVFAAEDDESATQRCGADAE